VPRSLLKLKRVVEATYRSNSFWELAPYGRLPAHERLRLVGSLEDPSFYGLLHATDGSRAPLSVCRDTALLFMTMQRPGRLPSYIIQSQAPVTMEGIARLVLDGVLEVRTRRGFLSGPDAAPHIFLRKPDQDGVKHPLGLLSRAALEYAACLQTNDVQTIARRLYRFNSVPLTPRLESVISMRTVAGFLGLEGQGAATALRQFWRKQLPEKEAWFAWDSLHRSARTAENGNFKLYISPRPDYVGAALQAALTTLASSRALSLKVARRPEGMVRPDKLVAYFADREDLLEAASALRESIGEIPSQGVPFTASLDTGKLLSWGHDPPAQDSRSEHPRSWREWVTLSLALSLVKLDRRRRSRCWRFALRRLELEGVDTCTWTASAAIWQQASPV